MTDRLDELKETIVIDDDLLELLELYISLDYEQDLEYDEFNQLRGKKKIYDFLKELSKSE